jgi:hypothetical protein
MEFVPFNPVAGGSVGQVRPNPERPATASVIDSAFFLENDIANLARYAMEPDFEYDPDFNLLEALSATEDFGAEPERFGRATSQQEFDYILAQTRQETEARSILAEAGWTGFVASAAAGMLSPTSLVPLAGPAKGIKGAAQAFALAGAAITAQEALLYNVQETRTLGESAMGVAMGTVLGGLLGSAAKYLEPAERVQLEQGMASQRGPMTISQLDEATGEIVNTRFNTIRETELPTIVASTRAGDEVTVYRPTGEAVRGRILPSMSAGVRKVELDDGIAQLDRDVFSTSPVSSKALIEVDGARIAVADLTDDQLTTAIARNAEELLTERVNVATHEQKILQSEVARRNGEAVEPEVLATKQEADDSAYSARNEGGTNSIGAATVKTRTDGLFKPGPIRGALIGALAKLNPLHRTIDGFSASGRNWAAKMSLGGVRIANGVENGPASGAATALARRDSLGVGMTDFVEAYNAAYVTHIYGEVSSNVPTAALRAAFATAKGNLRTPEGKLNYKDFGEAVFDSGNTGISHPDPSVNAAAKAMDKYFREVDRVNDVYGKQREIIDGKDFVPLYTRQEFAEDSDIQNYVHHMYDSQSVIRQMREFVEDLTKHGEGLMNGAFRTSHDAHATAMLKDLQRFADVTQSKAGFAATTKQLETNIAGFEKSFGAELLRAKEYGKQLKASGLEGKPYSDAMAAFREDFGPAFTSAKADMLADTKRLKELRAERNPIWDKRNKANDLARDKVSREFYAGITKRDNDFEQQWKDKGGDDVDVQTGTADFGRQATDDAQNLFRRITGNPHRVVGVDLIGEARGPQLQRTLNLPYDIKRKYLNKEPESVVRAHNFTMAPDLEMYRLTGSPNGKRILEEMEREHMDNMLSLNYATTEAEFGLLMGIEKRVNPSLRKQVPITEARRAKLSEDLVARHKMAIEDMQVLIDRFRNERGRPADANAFGYRAGRFARNLNVTRFMGTVVPSSLPDIARPVMRYGLESTYNHAWKPLVSDLKLVKMSNAAARRMNIATESLTHNRTQAMFDVGENFSTQQTMVERGMEVLANKTGFVALFDRWTDANKRLSTQVVFGEFSNALNVLAQGTRGPDYDKALIMMNRLSLSEDMVAKINRQFDRSGGSTEVATDFRLPNTEVWDDFETVMAMNGAITQEANDLIVTPGLDKPSWTDANEAYRVVGQFRSFSFASTNRTIMSGLQQSDMAYLNGAMMSLALGAVSYYAWGISAGGTMQERMMESTGEQWAYESLQRSGLLGVLSEGTRIGEQIPALNDYAIFGGEGRNSRRASSVMGSILGPSYDLGERLISIAQGLDEPTQSTLHSARVSMVPYQNVFYLRRLLDKVEEGLASNLPETRGQ